MFILFRKLYYFLGSHFGPNVRKWMSADNNPADLGQCFIAIDPQCFAPGFEGRMSDLLDSLRDLPSVSNNIFILYTIQFVLFVLQL